jgi:hypothetical protein
MRSRTNAFLAFSLAALVLGGCVPLRAGGTAGTPEAPAPGPAQADAKEAIAQAQHYLRENPNWYIDCSNFVLSCYQSPEMKGFFKRQKSGKNLTYYLNRYLTLAKTRRAKAADIQPGDILIFNMTYDLNRDGRIDAKDEFTHAGIVESFKDWKVTYLDSSLGRSNPKIRRRSFSFYPKGRQGNERVAVDPATGREILHKETFYAAYAVP